MLIKWPAAHTPVVIWYYNMNDIIDYTKYKLEELYDAADHIDKEKYSKQWEALKKEIAERNANRRNNFIYENCSNIKTISSSVTFFYKFVFSTIWTLIVSLTYIYFGIIIGIRK
jgi:hypothetical protein